MTVIEPIRLKPIFQPRVWGGDRLDPGAPDPVGEAWVVFEGSTVDGGVWAGRTLGEVSIELGARLLGDPVIERTGHRFPLLIKLLDSRKWLSVQVHPNDQQAERLEGPGNYGKTEAWHVLEAHVGARVISGLRGDPSSERLRRLAEESAFEEALNYVPVEAGDTLFTPAGTVHAIGPGLFIYEVQQTSDITYRLYDWNRPQSEGRALHLDKGLEVIEPSHNLKAPRPALHHGGLRHILSACDYFVLELVSAANQSVSRSTGGTSFHAITVTDGEVHVNAGSSSIHLEALQTVLVPAAIGEYLIDPLKPSTALVAYVPEFLR